MALFLKEQYSYHERKVLDEISKNETLMRALQNASETVDKIAALDEEIESDPNVLQLKEIIATASRRELTFEDALNDLPQFTKALLLVTRSFSRPFLDAIRIAMK